MNSFSSFNWLLVFLFHWNAYLWPLPFCILRKLMLCLTCIKNIPSLSLKILAIQDCYNSYYIDLATFLCMDASSFNIIYTRFSFTWHIPPLFDLLVLLQFHFSHLHRWPIWNLFWWNKKGSSFLLNLISGPNTKCWTTISPTRLTTYISHIKNNWKYLGLFLETHLKIHTSDILIKYKNQHKVLRTKSIFLRNKFSISLIRIRDYLKSNVLLGFALTYLIYKIIIYKYITSM